MQGSTPTDSPPGSDLNAILEASPDGIVIVAGGLVRFANRAAAAMLGRSADSLAGSPPPFALVENFDHTDTVEIRLVPAQWDSEPAVMAILRDISLHSSVQRIVRDGSDLSAVLIDVARALCVSFADACIIHVLEPIGTWKTARAVCDGISDETAASPHPLLMDALRSGRSCTASSIPTDLAAAFGITNGPFEPMSVLVMPIDAHGDKLGIVAVLRRQDSFSASERARMDAAVTVLSHAAEKWRLHSYVNEANQSKANFLAIMSHELRTPLNAIIGYGDLILMGVPHPVPDSAREHVTRIRGSAVQLLHIVEEILAFARMEAGREALVVESISVAALLDQLHDAIEPVAKAKQLELSIGEVPDAELRTDVDKVRQILMNLLSNAVKFTAKGSVIVDTEVQGESILFHVRDTGSGIENADIERIFQPFWQVESAQTRKAGGSGLGLSVARKFAHLLGGEILVGTNDLPGSTFTLQIPLTVPAPA